MPTIDYSYKGVGKCWMRDLATTGGLVLAGNISQVDISGEEETFSLADYTQPGGGIRNQISRVSGVGIALTFHDLDAENIGRAFFGTSSNIVAATITDEPIVGYLDELSLILRPGGDITAVKDATGTTTYTLGTDYAVEKSGVIALDGGAISDGDTLLVTYDHPEMDVVEAIVASSKEWQFVFDGVNEARSDKTFLVQAHRTKFGIAPNLSLIGDDYAGLELTGALLADQTKGAGKSKYFVANIIK